MRVSCFYILFWKIVSQSHGCIRLFAGSLDLLKLVYQANVSCWLWYMQCCNTSYMHLFGARSCTFLLHLYWLLKKIKLEKVGYFSHKLSWLVLLVTNRQMLHAATLLLDQTFELMVKIKWIKLWKSSLANKYVLQHRRISVNCRKQCKLSGNIHGSTKCDDACYVTKMLTIPVLQCRCI